MNREYPAWGIGALVIMTIGLLIGRCAQQPPGSSPTESEAFRAWLWQSRNLDLLIHIGLILGGALGIAALLPDEEER